MIFNKELFDQKIFSKLYQGTVREVLFGDGKIKLAR